MSAEIVSYVMECLWPDSVGGRCRSVAVAMTTLWLARKLYSRSIPAHIKFNVAKFPHRPGVLLLHQFSSGKTCVNLSPFALKLECFLRLSGIPYTVDNTVAFGPKRKCPWVNLEDGTAMGDSNFIITTLIERENEMKVEERRLPPGDISLTPRERGSLEGVRLLVEEQLFWCVIYWRYYLDRCKVFLKTQRFSKFLNFAFPYFMGWPIKRKCKMQGIATHTAEEVYIITKQTCKALDDYLGNEEFFCGKFPGTADCAVFGGLAQIMWNAPGSKYEKLVTEVFPSLSSYCNRMKERVFPDWEQIICT